MPEAGRFSPRATADERLRWLEAVTDTSLAHLTVEQLLDELLVRVRQILDVDTAAVLLLDPAHRFLIATTAQGIEEEVNQGVRIPVGGGFAGRIAKEKHWVALERVDHSNVLNPILRQKGIRSLLGVPLLAAGEVIGVLHVGTLSPRRFTEQDAALLQAVGDRIALATQAQITHAERAAAGIMQRGLLPTAPPQVRGLEFAARYVPGGNGAVGGDWYDVFSLPSGALCLATGDVVGHGLAAAQSMNQIRTALRSYALKTEDPARLLAMLDRYVQRFQVAAMASVICAIVRPSHDLLEVSSAGHLPPVLAEPDSEARIVQVPPDLPLGVDASRPRRLTPVMVAPGGVLCLYTDGLVERSGIPLDTSLERMRASVFPQSAESVCVSVMANLIGRETPRDDVALLVLRNLGDTTE